MEEKRDMNKTNFDSMRTDLTFYRLNNKEKEHYKNLLILSELDKS